MENTGLFNAEGKALSIADVMAMLPSVTFLEKVNKNFFITYSLSFL